MKINKILTFAATVATVALCACSSNTTTETTNDQATDEATEQVAPEAVEDAVVALADDNQYRPGEPVDKVTVLDFNATWCVPCKKLTPSFHKAAADFVGKANFVAVDVDQNPETAKAFGVESIPMVVIIQPDGTATSYVGLNPFVEGLTNDNPSTEELNEIILANLTKLVNEKL